MASLKSLSIPSIRETYAPQQEEPSARAFMQQWQPADASLLQPTHLSLSRVPRAWERKPLSPFSRQKMRVGKVWKRAAPVEIRKRRSIGANAKPIKKMRLDGLGAVSVARWDGEGDGQEGVVASPTRKIVLRRDGVGEEDLAALDDKDEDVGDVGGREEALVEVFDEEGTLLDVDTDDAEQQREWEDEEDFEPTMMHLGDIIDELARTGAQTTFDRRRSDPDAAETLRPENGSSQDTNQELLEASTSVNQDSDPQLEVPVRQEFTLPVGFVSPVKQRNDAKPKSTRKSVGSRRRTLPTEWKPSRLRQVENADGDEEEMAVAGAEESTEAQVLDGEELEAPVEAACEDVDQAADEEWEDMPDDEPHEELDTDMAKAVEQEHLVNEKAFPAVAIDIDQSGQASNLPSPEDDTVDDAQPDSPTKLPSSPVPSIEGQHPRLPLRRSPRRRSTSPVKQTAIRPSTEKSHLVAFTPIKRFQHASHPAASPIPLTTQEFTEEDPQAALLERSVSAPPEEPQLSPHRPSRPRVSDDTALLQAFLNRAAETRSSGRRISATKRESMTNRRDSDAVRQALASPVKPEVLAEMDPNSPSPRKSTIVSDEVDDANILPEPEPSPLHKTQRRSSRATRRAPPQTATPAAAPNKISIRGNSENVVLKKSEAQEVSQLTRTNTRRNKGGAVLPLYRLAKLQQQGIVDPLDDGAAVDNEFTPKPNSKGRALRWNETLVEFWQGGDVSETSLLSDELSSSGPAPSAVDNMEVEADITTGATAPPPPAETPSKPKVRRLKAPRTAAAPVKTTLPCDCAASSAPVEISETAVPPSKGPAPAKRRSRIATPAKGLSNSSLLPADLEPGPTAAAPAPVPAPQQKKAIPTPTTAGATSTGRRKAPVSKLPAPATTAPVNPTSTSSITLGQGKENQQSLISSPPKKKPASAGASLPSTKTFAPRLDFGRSASLAPVQGDGGPPGLASPAKKARKRGVVFAPPPPMGSQEDGGSGRERDGDVPPGLRSPAKKRTRRAVY